ncbi:MAG: hypothetical protein P9G45_15205 [Candidatus Contendobacter sp.]|nr:hypothetical protein [Candidatus Contendobacter sp.]
MSVRAWRGVVALVLGLAAGPAPGIPPRCQVVPAADARLRLEVWGRELAGAKGAVAAHSARRVAWVADRQGVVIEALFLVTLQAAGASGRPGASVSRPQWVRCTEVAGDERRFASDYAPIHHKPRRK